MADHRPLPRVGSGIDVHPFASSGSGRPLVLGGVLVPDAIGLAGHSDGDVLAHAVADALLGAAALGDLGSRFGVDDPALAGADSIALLRQVVADVADAGWTIGNVDATVLAQRPRLGPYRTQMVANLAAACAVPDDAVSVKFTTTDHLGFVGRGEGITSLASCLLAPLRATGE